MEQDAQFVEEIENHNLSIPNENSIWILQQSRYKRIGVSFISIRNIWDVSSWVYEAKDLTALRDDDW